MAGDEGVIPEVTLSIHGAPRPERADAARNRRILLEAAGRILRDKGVDALTMDAVAAEAGVGVGTVYRRFSDRGGLAYALLDDEECRFQRAFISGPPPLGPGTPPQERLRAFLHRYVERLPDHADLLAAAEDGTARYRAGAYTLHRQHLATLIGQIDPALDAVYLADALLAALSAHLFLYQHREYGMSLERLKTGLDHLLSGITS
ncbi:TetR/AcrR family transcriptional regulator [Phytoactinopolyspora halotolerans]|uniref:TetR/AcrR family transcriptional regulator n=1 Tax=Phytoactinopolyspora halotolerans TaxID=1981512 RepID=A0A6L9S4S0_9ACTN|nr:TetR/AcrR family transcriptional regulator [Phytoactinopolyspora halotolerans]NED99507.1 TetR/AcrR family transcriptional regulator [Phytoactinopolyspora halotolerans]